MRPRQTLARLIALLLSVCTAAAAERNLAEDAARLKIPPDWLAEVTTTYDTGEPWKEARQHIRKLLGQGKHREAIKLTYDYLIVRKVNKNTHEYPMYVYLGGEYAWAIQIYEQRLKQKGSEHAHESRCLASCYMKYGETDKALKALRFGAKHLPKPPWDKMAAAGIEDHMGDVYAQEGNAETAKRHYQKAMALYRGANPRYGRHLLPRRVAKIQAKLDLMQLEELDVTKLRDGVFSGQSIGYTKVLTTMVTLRGGRIVDIKVRHKENIEQGATRTIPQQIIEKQSLQVDAVTCATITTQAIVEATYRALQKAGLK